MSFKIFSQNQEDGPLREAWTENSARRSEIEKLITQIQNLSSPVGILLSHHYGYDSKSIYGCDKLLIDGFKSKGLEVDLRPVLVRFVAPNLKMTIGLGSHMSG